jgi:hypothetical protein
VKYFERSDTLKAQEEKMEHENTRRNEVSTEGGVKSVDWSTSARGQ